MAMAMALQVGLSFPPPQLNSLPPCPPASFTNGRGYGYGCSSKSRRVVSVRSREVEKYDYTFDYTQDLFEDGTFSDGLQEAEEPQLPLDPDSEFGYRLFPMGYNLEVIPLIQSLRRDVRRCCCFAYGGVYENLLLFPVIQILRDRYPGVKIDILATARGKQTYEINKNIKRAWPYDVDANLIMPAEYTENIGRLRGQYYDMTISTKIAGVGQSITLFLTGSRDRISYVYPSIDATKFFLTERIAAPRSNLAENGYHMYTELVDVISRVRGNTPKPELKPLSISIPKKLREVVKVYCSELGVSKGQFLLFHGMESKSAASMTSKGDPDSLLPLEMWAEIARSLRVNFVMAVPKQEDIIRAWKVLGKDTKVVFITTPGQLAALIDEAFAVVTTNTAAVQLAGALKKPCVAMFSSAEKASLYLPNAEERNYSVVASKTGKLKDVDLKEVCKAVLAITDKLLIPV